MKIDLSFFEQEELSQVIESHFTYLAQTDVLLRGAHLQQLRDEPRFNQREVPPFFSVERENRAALANQKKRESGLLEGLSIDRKMQLCE